MGRVRDSISRRCEGMGLLECLRAAPLWRRFLQGSVPGDASAHRPLTPFPPLNTVLILPDCNEEITRGMFKRFEELAKAGGILRVPVLFPGVTVLIQDATSDKGY